VDRRVELEHARGFTGDVAADVQGTITPLVRKTRCGKPYARFWPAHNTIFRSRKTVR
jgi:hypothetical protein